MLEQILKGGKMMVPLMACSVVSLAVVYDRWVAFRKNRRVDTKALRSKVLTLLRQDNVEGAIAECETSSGPIPAVLLFLAVLFAWKYPITRESHQATLQELAERES